MRTVRDELAEGPLTRRFASTSPRKRGEVQSRTLATITVIASEAKQSMHPRGEKWIASSLRSSQ
ncbi:hypothetical protein ACVW17_004604 [Bradyrhizobium sp. USDA 4473]